MHGIEEAQSETVQLGGDIYTITPQPIPYLKAALGPYFERLTSSELDASNFGDFVTNKAHELLSVFIPDLMPIWVWDGYRDEEGWKAKGDIDVEFARKQSPTGPQVRVALKAAFKANGIDLWNELGRLVDPTMLKGLVGRLLEGEDVLAGLKSQSSSSPPTPDSATSTSTTTDGPTAAASTEPPSPGLTAEDLGSPSPASTAS